MPVDPLVRTGVDDGLKPVEGLKVPVQRTQASQNNHNVDFGPRLVAGVGILIVIINHIFSDLRVNL